MPITLGGLHDKKTVYMCMLVTKPVVLDLSIVMENKIGCNLINLNIFHLHDQVINFLNEEKC